MRTASESDWRVPGFLLLLVVGCKASDRQIPDAGSVAATSAGGAPVIPTVARTWPRVRPKTRALPPEIAAWMPAGAFEAWQGTWETWLSDRTNTGRVRTALEVRGDQAVIDDGRQEYAAGFSVTLPCSADFQTIEGASYDAKLDSEWHFWATQSKEFILRRGVLVVGDGRAGMRRGRAAIVCAGMDVYTLDDAGRCRGWERDHLDPARARSVKCAWSSVDGKDVLTIGNGGRMPDGGVGEVGATLVADGDWLTDVWFDSEIRYHPTKPSSDLAATKAAVKEAWRSRDPSEKAKTAGGRVGDLSTVNGLQATFGSDPTLVGRRVEITGVVVQTSAVTSGNLVTYNVVIADASPRTLPHYPPTLLCIAGGAATGWAIGDRVTVAGKIKAFGDEASLDDCKVTKAQ